MYCHLVHFVFQFRQTACFHFLALTPSSNPYNALGMKRMDSFQKLIKGVVCVADNKDWPSFRYKRGLVTIIAKQFCTSIPLQFVMQQYIGNLKDKSSSFIVFDNMIMSNAVKTGGLFKCRITFVSF